MKHLALDFGEKRIGLAVSDDAGHIALPYGTHQRGGHKRDTEYLCSAIGALGIERIVLGLPRALNNEEESAKREAKIRDFATRLQDALNAAGRDIPMDFHDERFSTREAHSQLRALNISQKSSRQREDADSIDARAAANILQSYLDSQRVPDASP